MKKAGVPKFTEYILSILVAVLVGLFIWKMFIFISSSNAFYVGAVTIKTTLALDSLVRNPHALSTTSTIKLPFILDEEISKFKINVDRSKLIVMETNRRVGNSKILLFHNFSEYPEPIDDVTTELHIVQSGKKYNWSKESSDIPRFAVACKDIELDIDSVMLNPLVNEKMDTAHSIANREFALGLKTEFEREGKSVVTTRNIERDQSNRIMTTDEINNRESDLILSIDHHDSDGNVIVYVKDESSEYGCQILNSLGNLFDGGTMVIIDENTIPHSSSLKQLKELDNDAILISIGSSSYGVPRIVQNIAGVFESG